MPAFKPFTKQPAGRGGPVPKAPAKKQLGVEKGVSVKNGPKPSPKRG